MGKKPAYCLWVTRLDKEQVDYKNTNSFSDLVLGEKSEGQALILQYNQTWLEHQYNQKDAKRFEGLRAMACE